MSEHKGRCKICGREIIVKSRSTKYCRECAKQRRNEQSAKSQKLSWDERKEMLTGLICSATPPKTKPVIVNDRRTLCRGCEWARNEYCVLPSCFKEAIG